MEGDIALAVVLLVLYFFAIAIRFLIVVAMVVLISDAIILFLNFLRTSKGIVLKDETKKKNVKRKKRVTYLLIVLLVIATAYTIFIFSNPLRRSEEAIRNNVLRQTPIGSTIEDVIQVIDNNESWSWWGRHIADIGYPADATLNTRIGSQSIGVNLGKYSGGFDVYVVAFWGFDDDGILLDVRIRKDVAGF